LNKRTVAAVIFLVIILVAGSFSGGFFYSTFVHNRAKSSKGFDHSLLKEVLSTINNAYYDDISSRKMLNGAIDGMVESLDNPYAVYYTPKEYKHFKTSMSGHYSGIGIVIGGKKGNVKVLRVVPDAPAAKKGLKKGDLILEVDGKTTKKMNLDQAAEAIKGPSGTQVTLLTERASKRKEVKIRRAKITFPNISTKTFSKTGYINMHFFSGGVAEELKESIIKLQKKGIKNLILDLRSNPGGQLNEAVEVSSLFIDKGVVVRTKDKDKKETTYSSTGGKIFSGKLVILIGESSASASEIVAGAIQDRHRGTLVGVKSFGKGTVQQIIGLSNGGALAVPSEKWLTPNGRDITKKGITPNIVVKSKSNGTNNGYDKQLEKAKSLLK